MNYLDRIRAAAVRANAELDERHSGESGRMLVATVDAKPGFSWTGDHTVSAAYFAGPGSGKALADEVCARLAEQGEATPCTVPDCDRCDEEGCTWTGTHWENKSARII